MFEFEQEQADARKRAQEDQLALMGCYGVFVTDDRARRLLALWKQQSRITLPINASIQEYAAKEFARRFIDIIEDNIEQLKRNGGAPTSADDAHLR
jgi:hypothetical protein